MFDIIKLTDPSVLSSNCYIIISENAVSVVDPSVSYDEALKAEPKIAARTPKYVLLTHAHIDHIWEIDSYVNHGFEVCISSADSNKLSDKRLNCSFAIRGKIDGFYGKYSIIEDGDLLMLDNNFYLKALATPGHTNGSFTYIAESFAFTGDTLFADGGYGRYDLPTGNGSVLFNSLKKLFALPNELKIYPGHGDASTIKDTKRFFDI